MNPFLRPISVSLAHTTLASGLALILTLQSARAQSGEEFELRNGRRIPADSVKVTSGGFTATITVGTALQTLNFTAKDVVRAKLREPREVAEARTLIANEKPQAALDALDKVEPTLVSYRAIPDSWWLRATILRMDALAALGKREEAAALVTPDVLSDLSSDDAALLRNFQQIAGPPAQDLANKVEVLQSMAQTMNDPWVGARIWLEIGNTLASQGRMEDAVKAWLRVPVFFPAERDLAARGTILGARGLQQIDRPADGVKLLEDYLADHLASPYKDTMQVEAGKLDPERLKDTTTETPETSAEPAEAAEEEEPAEAEESTN